MPRKKSQTTVSTANKKADKEDKVEAKASKTTKSTTARQTKVAKPVEKKIDVVEEAKKELERLEAQSQARATQATPAFPWGIFCGAVVLTLAAVLIVWKVMAMMTVSRLTKLLPDVVEPLGGGMELEEIGKPTNESGVYSFTIKFADYDDVFTSYITRDGKMFFVEAYEVEDILAEAGGTSSTARATATCDSLSKTAQPMLDVYVSSDCGYCKQAEVEMYSAVEQVPELADQIKLHYAGSIGSDGQVISFLGSEAAGTENLRQVCLRDEQHDVFWDYVGCMASGGESETCLADAGANTSTLNACMEDASRGLAAITADINRADELVVTGTPSFFVNDEESVSDIDFGGRVPDSYKEIICCASSDQPGYCETTLD